MSERIFVTGGLGFVGSRICGLLLKQGAEVITYDNVDKKSTNPKTIENLQKHPRLEIVEGDILDEKKLEKELKNSDAIIHAAAISSVDRSIKEPALTTKINVLGTLNVLESAKKKGVKRVHFVSTDEVFGQAVEHSFNEQSLFAPRNPYASSKLASEALMQSWSETFGMEITITNSVNNYGPYQSPEKLIPRLCVRGINGNTLPVYGNGKQVREWLFVDDHAKAILHVLNHGTFNQRYCVGSGETRENIEIVKRIISSLGLKDEVIEYVSDRKGHDIRYAVDSSKIHSIGWKPEKSFEEGLTETIEWYKNNRSWWEYYLVTYPDLAPTTAPLPST